MSPIIRLNRILKGNPAEWSLRSAWKCQNGGGPDLAVFRRGYRVLIHFDRGPEFRRSCETRRRRFFFLKIGDFLISAVEN